MKRLALLATLVAFLAGFHWQTPVRGPVVRTDDVSTSDIEFKGGASIEIHLDENDDNSEFLYVLNSSNLSVLTLGEYGEISPSRAQILYDETDKTLDFSGVLGGYNFGGPVSWAGDGSGARLELQLNLFNWPWLTDDTWALYGKEDGLLRPNYYLESKRGCTDEYSGPDTCPGTMTASQTSTAGADGYCDDFDTWGSCYPVQDRQQISTSSVRQLEKQIIMRSNGMAFGTSWMGAKCAVATETANNMEWCNDPTTRITVPVGYEAEIDKITLQLISVDIATITGGNELSDCTIFLNTSDERDTDATCNQPGDPDATDCALDIVGTPLAHVGVTTLIGGGTWPRLDERGEVAVFEDIGATATAWWRLQVDHRHECNAASDNDGDACWNNADCPSGLCVHKTQSVEGNHNGDAPYECQELPAISANVLYSIRKLETY
jgi:hypothetical protein